MTEEDYLFTQLQLFHISFTKFMRNGNKFKGVSHKVQHKRLIRRILFLHGEKQCY